MSANIDSLRTVKIRLRSHSGSIEFFRACIMQMFVLRFANVNAHTHTHLHQLTTSGEPLVDADFGGSIHWALLVAHPLHHRTIGRLGVDGPVRSRLVPRALQGTKPLQHRQVASSRRCGTDTGIHRAPPLQQPLHDTTFPLSCCCTCHAVPTYTVCTISSCSFRFICSSLRS